MKFCLIVLFYWTSNFLQVDTKPCSENCLDKYFNLEDANHERVISHANDTALETSKSYVEVKSKRSIHKHVTISETNSTISSNASKTRKANTAKKIGKPNGTTEDTVNKKNNIKKMSNESDTLPKKHLSVDKNNELHQKNGTQTKLTEEGTNYVTKKTSSSDKTSNSEISKNDNTTTSRVNYTVTQNEINKSDKNKNSDGKDAGNLNVKNKSKTYSEQKSKSTNKEEKIKNTSDEKSLGKMSKKNTLSSIDKKHKIIENMDKDKKKSDDNSIDDSKGGKNIHSQKKYKIKPTKSMPKNSTIVPTKQRKAKLDKTMSVFKQKQIKTNTVSTPSNDKTTAKSDKVSSKIKKNLAVID